MKKRSYAFIGMGAAFWASISIFVNGLYEAGFSALEIVFLRVLSATLIMLVYISLTNRDLFNIRFSDLYYFIGTGIFSLVFFNWCYFTTIREASVAIAAILLYTAPIFVLLMSRMVFKEKLSAIKVIALAIAVTGCALISGYFPSGGALLSSKMILIGLGSGFGYALYTIVGKAALEKYDPMTVITYTFVVASIGLLPISGMGALANASHNMGTLFYVLGLGLIPTVLGYILYTKGLHYIDASKASIIAAVEPVVATTIGISVFHEVLSIWQFAGIMMILIAVLLAQKGNDN
ncbi:DMT family transporter [Methanococcoides sp. FTZ1]|uniref:DMT family transporter n=1 Tax=Methanococcoides sp. FTZ1 TaxID=3439061 RepID=UPI003F86288A